MKATNFYFIIGTCLNTDPLVRGEEEYEQQIIRETQIFGKILLPAIFIFSLIYCLIVPVSILIYSVKTAGSILFAAALAYFLLLVYSFKKDNALIFRLSIALGPTILLILAEMFYYQIF